MRTGSVVTNIAATAGLGPAAPPRRALALLALILVAVLVTAGAGRAGDGRAGAGPANDGRAGVGPASAGYAGGAAAPPEVVGLGRAIPIRLLIPVIEVDARVAPLGLGEHGLTGAPADQLVGWYRDGTSPGELGSAVLLGQLEQPRTGVGRPASAPAAPALAGLARLRTGDHIEVLRADGLAAQFRVESIAPYSPARAAPSPGGEAQLRLVGAHGVGPEWTPRLVVVATLVP